MAKKKAAKSDDNVVVIEAPDIRTAAIAIRGTAPYVQHKFAAKAKATMLAAQTSSKGKTRKAKEPRDLDEDYEGAFHRMPDGSYGIPCPAFRSAMISACRVAGFVMTKAKLSVFVQPDGFDAEDATPLVKLEGEPEQSRLPVRLENGVCSIAVRPMWKQWSATVRVSYDADQFSETDVVNLLARAGLQVGIGEGRPDSKKSHGCGWGTFEIVH